MKTNKAVTHTALKIFVSSLAILLIILVSLYASYWKIRLANPNLIVPKPFATLFTPIDKFIGINWEVLIIKPEPLTYPKRLAPDLVGITKWYYRQDSNYSQNIFSIKENIGIRPTLLVFGRLYCSFCLNVYTNLNDFTLKYSDRLGIIALQSPKYDQEKIWADIVKELEERSILFPVGLDLDRRMVDLYKVELSPSFYLIDKNGYIVYSKIGGGNIDELTQAIEEVL